MYLLVLIFKSNEVLLGGLSYGTLQPHCARIGMASLLLIQAKLQDVAKLLLT